MDIPGLNEAPEVTNISKDEKDGKVLKERNQNAIIKNFYFNQIFPLIQNNIIFSLFIFSAENYDGINAQEILDSYLEGGIVGKEKKKKEENKLSFGEKENERFKQKKK